MMKSSIALLALAGAATAYTIADFVPECAVVPLEDGVKAATPCAVDDLECICIADNYRATYTAALAAVLQACGSDTAVGEVLPGATHMCEVVLSSTFSSAAPSTSAVNLSSTVATEVPASTTESSGETSASVAPTIQTSVATTATSTASTTDKSSVPSATSSVATAGAAYCRQILSTIPGLVLAVLAWI